MSQAAPSQPKKKFVFLMSHVPYSNAQMNEEEAGTVQRQDSCNSNQEEDSGKEDISEESNSDQEEDENSLDEEEDNSDEEGEKSSTKGSKKSMYKKNGEKKPNLCAHPPCEREASCGVQGGKRQYCAKHKEPGMISLIYNCKEEGGCPHMATHGYGGKGRGNGRRFCEQRDGVFDETMHRPWLPRKSQIALARSACRIL